MSTFKSFKDIYLEESLMTGDVSNYLYSGDDERGHDPVMVRKPTDFNDLYKAKSVKRMPADVQKFLNSLPTISWKDVYGGVTPVKGAEFWKPHKGIFRINTPQWFKIKFGTKIILVDTSGYDHPRYAAFLKK